MVPHLALGILATQAGTRVIAVIVAACLVTGTVRVDHTLRLAFSIRVSEQSWRTGALAVVSDLPWNGSRAARVGITRISNIWFS